MNVYELNDDQLSQLKWNLFYVDKFFVEIPWDMLDRIEDCDYPDMIPTEMVYELYDGISFVEEDFS